MKETHNLEIGDVEISLKSKFIQKLKTYYLIPNTLRFNTEYQLDNEAVQAILSRKDLVGIHNGSMVYLEFNHIKDNIFMLKGFRSLNEKD